MAPTTPRSLTSANAIIMLTIPGLYTTPQQLQGFSADNVYDVAPVEQNQTSMGVDGYLSAGKVLNPTDQSITLKADSLSNDIFDLWAATELQQIVTFRCSGSTVLPGLGKRFVSVNGVLITWPPIPSAAKNVQDRKAVIRWQSVTGVPI